LVVGGQSQHKYIESRYLEKESKDYRSSSSQFPKPVSNTLTMRRGGAAAARKTLSRKTGNLSPNEISVRSSKRNDFNDEEDPTKELDIAVDPDKTNPM